MPGTATDKVRKKARLEKETKLIFLTKEENLVYALHKPWTCVLRCASFDDQIPRGKLLTLNKKWLNLVTREIVVYLMISYFI